MIKKASKDQWAGLVSVSFFVSSVLELSFYSLSLILLDTQSSWSTLGECGILGCLGKEGKEREGKHKRKLGSTTTMGFSCRYRVACMFSSLVLACMAYACGFLVMICHWHGGLLGLTVDLPSLTISWITMMLWVHFFVFLVGSNVPLVVG